uniref:U6 snRNA-associated Sm-like protein LSm1 n=1 Tax=Noctiluca scintillans TaxID=2966 RepID=A0A7S0ZW15_NOCSC
MAEDVPGMRHWASNLSENVDKKLLVLLRDGRKLIGWLRTFDQFANLLLENTVERHILCDERKYADVYLGAMLIRGENVCLFGEIDGDVGLSEAPLPYVLAREAELQAELQAELKAGRTRQADFGFDLDC